MITKNITPIFVELDGIQIKQPTATPMNFPWNALGENFITYFTLHSIERLQEYRIDLTTINHPITKLANQILDMKIGNKFAIVDKITDVSIICEIESAYDLSIYINVITVVRGTTFEKKVNDFALRVDSIYYVEEY